MSDSPSNVAALQRAMPTLHTWYARAGRDLPWRRTRDPYSIWISEVMLQQTRVQNVIPYYQRWLERFPNPSALAAAGDQEVLVIWEGLGYYSRARNLHLAAQELVRRHSGRIPDDPSAFRALPGVGEYTTAAVMSIAFGRDLAVVDGNVRRVLCRLVGESGDPRRAKTARALAELARTLLPPGTAATHNQAVMELGALICTPRSPRCPECPLEQVCLANQLGAPESYPSTQPRATVPRYAVAVGIVLRDGKVFIDRRPYGGLLGGLWEFPGGKSEPGEHPEQTLHRELMEEFGLRVEIRSTLPTVSHAYSHFKVTLHPFLCTYLARAPRVGETQPWKWVAPAELADHPMPKANHKILALPKLRRALDLT